MELNIIAPNLAGGGDALFDVRSASGNLGDLIIYGTENKHLQNMVDEGLVLDMSDMLKNKEIMRYQSAINTLNQSLNQGGIYAIPTDISTQTPTQASEGMELTYGPYLRWDIYASIGYPRMHTLEDLLPVLKAMQKAMPFTESGQKTYGISFFKDWDGNMMTYAKQPACFYGYDEIGFVFAKADGSDFQNIVDKNSFYMRNLKLYFKANQMGLVDPDSTTQSYFELGDKYSNGSILYSPWPWQCQSAFNTLENKEKGKGYMLAPIDDMKILSYGCVKNGNQKTVISIGSQAKDPERLANFINWLYSPEGIQIAGATDSGGAAGPEGLTWDMHDDGPYLTDFGKKAFYSKNVTVPDEWGGGTWADGISQLNFHPVIISERDPNGYPYSYSMWDSVLESQYTPLDIDWRTHLNTDAISTHDYLEKNKMMIIAPGTDYVPSDSSSDITTIRDLCRSAIVNYSWKMVFAKDENTFNDLYNRMLEKLNAYGYDKVLAQDMKNAREQDTERKEAAKSAY